MKQTSLILLVPIIGIVEVFLTWQEFHWLKSLVYLEMIVICLCGIKGLRDDLWLFLALFYSWVAVSNQLISFTPKMAGIEAGIFFALVYWVNKRPLWMPSDPKSDTLQFAFYRGDKIPFIAKLGQLFGLKLGGVAVIIGDSALRPVGTRGVLELRPRDSLNIWVKLDTKIKVTKELKIAFNKLIGQQTGKAGCLRALKPLLSHTPFSGNVHPEGLARDILDSRLSA